MAVREEPKVALVYDDDAYVEAGGVAPGLMGRQVAGRSFLEAYLRHGKFSEMAALVRQRSSADSLVQLWREQSSGRNEPRTLRVIEAGAFHETFFPASPAKILHAPQPPDPSFAWARQQGGPHAFALSGVTHTLCSTEAVALLRSLVTAPFEPYDALVCTSRSVLEMVREVTGAYADHLRARLVGPEALLSSLPLPLRLEIIPLGVDTDRFTPATAEERAAARTSLGVASGAVAILYVGRLSHHAKAHPFPMFRGASLAAAATGRPVHLLLAGWTAHPAVREAYLDGARTFAANVRTSLLDGRDPKLRRDVWHAADIFVSPSDNIQETFGLAVVEAMASGLPVVASDWNGYRDLVVDGQTGFLVPTAMVLGATAAATARLLTGELSYDHFLAEVSQATAIDTPAMAAALGRLIGDDSLRAQMGAAGRRRAVQQFSWFGVIKSYERLWSEQEAERSACALAVPRSNSGGRLAGPAAYPAPERTFGGYPTRRLDDADRVVAAAGAVQAVEGLLTMPLTHHASDRRVTYLSLVRAALAVAPASVGDFDRFWAEAGIERCAGRATIAWMLKYDLLRAANDNRPAGEFDP
jgi:glycosyltransferase involved in cell wall biosynthesis